MSRITSAIDDEALALLVASSLGFIPKGFFLQILKIAPHISHEHFLETYIDVQNPDTRESGKLLLIFDDQLLHIALATGFHQFGHALPMNVAILSTTFNAHRQVTISALLLPKQASQGTEILQSPADGTATIGLDAMVLTKLIRQGLTSLHGKKEQTIALKSIILESLHLRGERIDVCISITIATKLPFFGQRETQLPTIHMQLRPTIKEQKIDLGLDHTELGKFGIPGILLGIISHAFSREVSQFINGFSQFGLAVRPKEVYVANDYLRIGVIVKHAQAQQ